LLLDGVVEAADPLGECFGDPFGAHAQVFGGQQVVEGHAGGAFPRLAGDPGAAHSSVDRGLGGSGVVAVEVTGRNGLQDVQVEDGTAHEWSLSVVSSEVSVPGAGLSVVLGR